MDRHWRDELAVFVLPPNANGEKGPSVFAGTRFAGIAPQEVASLRRAKAGVGHDQHEVMKHLTIPACLLVLGRFNPRPTSVGINRAVFLGRESFAARLPKLK